MATTFDFAPDDGAISKAEAFKDALESISEQFEEAATEIENLDTALEKTSGSARNLEKDLKVAAVAFASLSAAIISAGRAASPVAFDTFKQSVDLFQASVGRILAPILIDIANLFQFAADVINSMPEGLIELITFGVEAVVVLLAVASVVTAATAAWALLTAVVGAALGPIGLLIALLAAIGVAAVATATRSSGRRAQDREVQGGFFGIDQARASFQKDLFGKDPLQLEALQIQREMNAKLGNIDNNTKSKKRGGAVAAAAVGA